MEKANLKKKRVNAEQKTEKDQGSTSTDRRRQTPSSSSASPFSDGSPPFVSSLVESYLTEEEMEAVRNLCDIHLQGADADLKAQIPLALSETERNNPDFLPSPESLMRSREDQPVLTSVEMKKRMEVDESDHFDVSRDSEQELEDADFFNSFDDDFDDSDIS